MPKENNKVPVISFKEFQGISDYPKQSANFQVRSTYYFGRAINYRDDPNSLTLLPGSLKESGSVVIDLLKWADIVPVTLTSYAVGNAGNFYSRTSAGVWTNLYMIPQNHGNGLAYFSGDDYVYVAGDISLSRYGPTQSSPTFTSNFLAAQGGIPMNTASILLAAASTMYGHAADSASLSITGNLTLEAYFKMNSLPAVGSSMTILGKWDESAATKSYKMDIYAISGYFGDGSDGALTISSNTTEAPIDSAFTGTAGTQTGSATNASFAQGQVVLIHQSQGTNAGQWERNTIAGYTAGTITFGTPLLGTYVSRAQIRVLKQYSSITIDSGKTWTAKAWTGTVGGILANLCSGTLTINGFITADNKGFRFTNGVDGAQGEGTAGSYSIATAANGNGGGGGSGGGTYANIGSGAGGGGNASVGTTGTVGVAGGPAGIGGDSSSAILLTTMTFGGAGGTGGAGGSNGGIGGNGGGIIFLTSVDITFGVAAGVSSNGQSGIAGGLPNGGGGGGGGGGSILLKAQTATLGTNQITATGGGIGVKTNDGGVGGEGSSGVVHLDYLTSYTGSTTSPTLTATVDSNLVTTTTYQARLGISNDGTASEYLSYNLSNLTTATWNRLSISWTASTSKATFYLNGVSLGTFTGTKTTISDNASLLYVGNNKTSVLANYFDGLLNDVRIWSNVQTATQIFANLNQQVPVASAGLAAYYKFNSAATDATGNANDLTLVNSPTYSSDVPFSAPTTRLDIDQSFTTTGQDYDLLTAISENAVDTLAVTPVTDPQASVAFNVNGKGTGNWTVTVHDQQNRVIASQTITNANLPASGYVEFIYSSPWRIVSGKNYHMHLTSTVNDGSVVGSVDDNFSNADFYTYFGYLVPDTQFHPLIQFQSQPLGGTLTGAMIIGNERYIGVWDGANYYPNFLQFPPGWHVRCFGFWRQYLAIGMWRGGAITDFDRGRVYFWTGYQPAYDFFIDVPEGQINALFGVDSDLYIFAGYRGILLDYKGGFFYNTGNSSSNKLKRMPLLAQGDYTEVYPGALTMWRGLLHFGLYANTNSTTAQQGTYSFGSLNQFYPDTLSYDYVISTGNKSSSVSLGLVYAVGQNLIVGWQDGIAYGADVINFSNPPAASGELQTLIIDNGSLWRSNLNLQLRADFRPLASGESIDLKYSLDRAAFATGTIDSTVEDSVWHTPIAGGRGKEIQFGVDLYATGSTSPTLLEVSLLQDLIEEEEQF